MPLAASRLEEKGVVFVRLVDDAGVERYSVVYKGEVIVPNGSPKELRKSLDGAWNKTGDDLVEELGKLKVNAVLRDSGSGGFLKYTKVISRNMLMQEESMSCAAACIRQLAEDNGIKLTEVQVRIAAGTSKSGTAPIGIVMALEDFFKEKIIITKNYFRNEESLMPTIIKDVTKEGSWIAEIHPPDGLKHAVIVDKVIGQNVYIRDPWPLEDFSIGTNGVEAIVNLEQFSYSWLRGGATRYQIK